MFVEKFIWIKIENSLASEVDTQCPRTKPLIVALQGVNARLLEIQDDFLNLTKTHAIQLLPQIQPLQPILLDLQTKTKHAQTHTTNKVERLVLNEFDAILKNIAILFNDIVEIATDEIDENSTEFETFLVDYLHNDIQNDIKALKAFKINGLRLLTKKQHFKCLA